MDTSKGVPVKISPDSLVDAIVEFQIATEYKAEKIEQLMLGAVERNFPKTKFRKFSLMGADKGKHAWADNVFRYYVGDEVISLNIVSKYPGWMEVVGFLKGALQDIYESPSRMLDFQRVRINYVSHFHNLSIFEVWDGNPIKLNNFPPFVGREFNFKFGIFRHEKNGEKGELVAHAEVHLSDNNPVMDSDIRYSRIDVGLESKPCDGSWADAYENLQILHFHEKEIFYKLLSEEFVNKLNPVWLEKK